MMGRGLNDPVRSLDQARSDIERSLVRERLRHIRIAGKALEPRDAAFASPAAPPSLEQAIAEAEAAEAVAQHIAAITPPRRRRLGPVGRFLRRLKLWDEP
jgi:hypothetical protein